MYGNGRTHRDNTAFEVPVKMNLPDHVPTDIDRVVVARLRAVRRPARRHLAVHCHRRVAPLAAEVHDVVADTRVGHEECVLLRDWRERERDHAALRDGDLAVLRGERAVLLHVPGHEVTGRGRGALVGGKELATVLAEDDLAERARRAVCGCGLVIAQVAKRVGYRDEAELLVDREAAMVIYMSYSVRAQRKVGHTSRR